MTILEAENLCVFLPTENGSRRIFENVDLALEAGRIYDLVGPSGSGKSTLLRALARMVERERGHLFLKGTSEAAITPAAWRARVCLVPQKPSLIPGTVRDNLLLPWSLKIHADQPKPNETRLRDLMDDAGLDSIDLDHDSFRLSGGQAARVALLRAFVTEPDVMLLDEVDAALDADTSHAISVLTSRSVKHDMTCLRIRHRESDGFAHARFTLSETGLSREDTSAPSLPSLQQEALS